MKDNATLLATRFLPGEEYEGFTAAPDLVCYIASWQEHRFLTFYETRYVVRLVDVSERFGVPETSSGPAVVSGLGYESEIYDHPAFALAEFGRITGQHASMKEIDEVEGPHE